MSMLGRVALVTGGAKRVGRAIAVELAAAGCDVAVHYRTSANEAEEVAERIRDRGCRACCICGDLADLAAIPAIVEQAVGELGRLDILVNNASVFDRTPLPAFDAAEWERVFRINLIAPAALAAAARAHLSQSGAGAVVNLCDISAERPWRDYAAYCASKAALVCLTKSLAKELAPAVRVNGVSPGIAEFPDDYDEATRQKLIGMVPLKRAGTPQDIAGAVRYLVEQAHYVTGEVLTVDGGRRLR